MTAPTIRKAGPEDAELLAELAHVTFRDTFADHPKNAPDDLADYMRRAFSREQISFELSDERNIFLLAEIDDEPAGYARIIIDHIEPGITAERPVELNRLYSHQEFLGRGVGQALMNACLEQAKEKDRDVMWLGVWEYNPRALRFYEKNGFRVVGEHVFQLGADAQTDLLMQKDLTVGAATG